MNPDKLPVIPILFEDTSILVIDKPAGIVVNRSQTSQTHTLQDWLDLTGKIQSDDGTIPEFKERSGIVHRLDKETSGVLVVAKTPEAFTQLQHEFKERNTQKTYRAIVHGHLDSSEGEIKAPIARLPWNRMRYGIMPNGKESITRYRRDSYGQITDEQVTILTLYPHTGRTHQLRVHLAYLGYPIVGDDLYSGRKRSKATRLWSGRLMLHAWKLEINHPNSHARLAFVAPIPDDMRRILDHAAG